MKKAVVISIIALIFTSHSYGSIQKFERIATFPVYLNGTEKQETAAEIMAASEDGQTLIYTDSPMKRIGFVNIKTPSRPLPLGTLALEGEPTSVAIKDGLALVCINTSENYINANGKLLVVDIATQTVLHFIPLGGQPDSIAISPDGKYGVIAIENERNENLNDGAMPQSTPGYLAIIDLVGKPKDYRLRKVDLVGLADLFPEDPEPEYVDINTMNVAAVTLQENNHIVLVYLPTGDIINHFSAGFADLVNVDTVEDGVIRLDGSLQSVPREPDGLKWVSSFQFATADEGDYKGGTRGYTIFNVLGGVSYTAGNSMEHELIRHGHYPEGRSENKGNEPENTTYGEFGSDRLLFVGSERGNAVLVYQLNFWNDKPEFLQLLPAGVKPEGMLTIPKRNLFVVAAEEDDESDGVRSTITIFERGATSSYPTVISADDDLGRPIPWYALSGLASRDGEVFAVVDSFAKASRILKLNVENKPAVVKGEIVLVDRQGRLKEQQPDLVNDDNTVNLDLEGISMASKGGFWLVSEGNVAMDDKSKRSENILLKVSLDGEILQVNTLPPLVQAKQVKYGFEGVSSQGSGADEEVFIAFQRPWIGDPENHVRIAVFSPAKSHWQFFNYPLDKIDQEGSWIGLSEITRVGQDEFAVVERDNLIGKQARVKKVYRFSVAEMTRTGIPTVEKKLVLDLIPVFQKSGGLVPEKIEGFTILKNGDALVVNDNDGLDDNSGETMLLRIPQIF